MRGQHRLRHRAQQTPGEAPDQQGVTLQMHATLTGHEHGLDGLKSNLSFLHGDTFNSDLQSLNSANQSVKTALRNQMHLIRSACSRVGQRLTACVDLVKPPLSTPESIQENPHIVHSRVALP
ncbi:hypothetical protein THIARS_50409 [Thiomonas delicata]|uniref:Uncharacterized protein n=1 Tax=Thiomonas delicata TaxID=364030 RepID=A0A238D1N7_THIDL|nr:hypothetical protein THIARS_50409 [Thiomonas delicata]